MYMSNKEIADGTAHKMPGDLKRAITSNPKVLAAWGSLTPLARNEWICWNVTVKQAETRKNHILRTVKELQEGKRRPCCWMGCIHRTDKPMNASQKWITSKKSKN